MAVNFQTSPVFDWNYRSQARVKINQGGTYSGKTYAILQVICMRLIQKKKIAIVVGEDIPNLKKGALRDFQERILKNIPWINAHIKSYNATDRRYTFINGSILEFTSFKDGLSARSGKREIAFFNEANSIGWEIYRQVALRTTEEIFIDYNPSEEFWAHEQLMSHPKTETFYSNFRHNPWCDPNVREYLLELRGIDENAWNVYGLGKTGILTETIYKNVRIVDEMPEHLKYRGYGMDIGYTNDPTALIDCGLMNGNEIYADEVLYEYRLRSEALNQEMIDKGVSKKRDIWCDSSEPRLIDDLLDYRWNAYPAEKGDGSVKYGINLLQGYKLHFTQRSINMISESKKYKFKVDKTTGRVLSEPVKAFDHAMDALRYWAVMNLKPITGRYGVTVRDQTKRA